jgi:hypothetical protein
MAKLTSWIAGMLDRCQQDPEEVQVTERHQTFDLPPHGPYGDV